MHFTLLTQYYPPEIGAPPARLSQLTQYFIRRGHSVSVLTAMPNYPLGQIYPGYGGLVRREEMDGMEVIRTFIYPTQQTDYLRRLMNYFSFVLSSATVGSALLGRTDYLFVESPPLFLGLSGFWLRWLKRARLIFNVSDLWPESAVQLGVLRRDSLLHRMSLQLEAFYYRRAWLITGQSKSILADISSRFPNYPTFHISNGVDTTVFHPQQHSEQTRWLRKGNEDCLVLYAGLHGLAQGLDQVLSVAETLQDDKKLRFALIGDGLEKPALMQQAHQSGLSNVDFYDPRPAAEIPALLTAADILVVTLKQYIPGAVPSKLYEAMASGRPVILVASGEAADIVRTHKAGIVVEPGNVTAFVKAVQTLREDPIERRVLGENGRRAAVAHYDRSTFVNRFIDYLEANL